jgi:hypothetical protein
MELQSETLRAASKAGFTDVFIIHRRAFLNGVERAFACRLFGSCVSILVGMIDRESSILRTCQQQRQRRETRGQPRHCAGVMAAYRLTCRRIAGGALQLHLNVNG